MKTFFFIYGLFYYHTVVSHQVELIIMQYFTYKEWKMKKKSFYIIVYISSTLLTEV